MSAPLSSAFDTSHDPAHPDDRIAAEAPGVLTAAPAPRSRRRSAGSTLLLSAGRCEGTGWLLQVTAPAHTFTWTTPVQPPGASEPARN